MLKQSRRDILIDILEQTFSRKSHFLKNYVWLWLLKQTLSRTQCHKNQNAGSNYYGFQLKLVSK